MPEINDIATAIAGWSGLLSAVGIVLLLLVFYALMCRTLAVFAESRGESFRLWFSLCFILTPLFAPSLFFFLNNKSSYFVRIFYASIMGVGFTFFYMPYAMFASLISRAMSKD